MNSSPYIISNWVKENSFYGRVALTQALINSAERCIYLVGTRRIGKTSLLLRLAQELQPHGLYCDLMRAAGSEHLDEARLVQLMRRQLAAQAPHSTALQESRAIWDREASSLCAWLEEVAWRWEELGCTVTLLWDEAELLKRLPDSTLMPLRAILQHSSGLRIIICASKALADLNDRWRTDQVSPFLFGFTTEYLTGLLDQEANDLIRQHGRVTVSDEVAQQIREWCGNHPFLLQVFCSRLYEAGRLRQPTAQDRVIDSMLADIFRADIRALSPGEQAILAALATGEPQDLASIRAQAQIAPEAAQSFVYGLRQLGLLRPNGEHWELGNGFLARWLRSNPPAVPPIVTDRASLELLDLEQRPATTPNPNSMLLSEREQMVVRLVAAGLTNPEIARQLTIAPDTVKAHLKNIMGKLNTSNRAQTVARAKELGLL